MKTCYFLLFFMLSGMAYSQTKKELINAIITKNVVDDGPNYSASKINSKGISNYNYDNFEKLKKMISQEELLNFAKGENTVLRTYSIQELIWSNNKKYNLKLALEQEIEKDQTVETESGCIVGDIQKIYSILYHTYWNLTYDVKRSDNITLQELDAVIINSEKSLYWLLYLRVFENGRQNDTLLPQIERLAFNRNNYYALFYLRKYHPDAYNNKIEDYFTNQFPIATFQSDGNDVVYFESLIELLLEDGSEKMKDIAIEKLKKEPLWREYQNNRFLDILEAHHIKL
jgi:hypothetical protein